MKKIYTYFKLVSLIMILINPAYAKLPDNLTCAKLAVINYYESGEYEKDVGAVVKNADEYLEKRIKENHYVANPKKLAIVFDIDDTLLSNFPENKKRDFSGLPQLIEEGYQHTNAVAVKPMLQLFNKAIKNQVSVFLISYRPDTFRSYTITNLNKAGYYGWTELYLPNQQELKLAPQIYKTAMRQMLVKKGYQIILNMGDQDSDLEGGMAEHVEKIPNPIYGSSKSCKKLPACS